MNPSNESNISRLIKDTGIAYEENRKYRDYMEDYCKIHLDYNQGNVLFTLFDGYLGIQVADEATNTFPEVFLKSLEDVISNPDDHLDDYEEPENEDDDIPEKGVPEKALKDAFKKLDSTFAKYEDVGATACVAYICVEDDKKVLYSGNVGDSRIVLVNDKNALRLTYDHKASDKKEKKRVKKDGGAFYNNRLGGILAITRALGDFSLKTYGLSSVPFLKQTILDENDSLIVIASDGVFDVINEEKLFRLISDQKSDISAQELSDVIVKSAVELGSKDNISCIVAKLI